MTAQIIDGKSYAEGLRGRIAGHVSRLEADHGITPGLAVVIVGHDPASQIYVTNKAKQTVEVGMYSEKYELRETAPEAEVLALIKKLNAEMRNGTYTAETWTAVAGSTVDDLWAAYVKTLESK